MPARPRPGTPGQASQLPIARRKRRRHGRRRHRTVAMVFLTLAVVLTAAAAAALVIAGNPQLIVSCSLGSSNSRTPGRDSFVYAADGSRLGAVPTDRNREPVSLKRMSPEASMLSA